MGIPFPEGDTKEPAKDNNAATAETNTDSSDALRSSLYTRPERSPWSDPKAPNLLPIEITGNAKELKPEQPAGGDKPADKPAAGTDKAAEKPGEKPADKAAGKVTTDKDGYVTDIEYPGGKTRHIERDGKTHEATSMLTTTSDATTQLVNENGKWSLTMQAIKLPVSGQIEVMKNGEINTKQPGSNIWKVEKTDGSIVDEKENPDGARLRMGADGKPERLIRPDKSIVEQVGENKIVESRPGQKEITWTRDGDSWKSDAELPARKNLKINEDGKVSFTDGRGVRHEISTRGDETLQGDGAAKITNDSLNRPKEVELQDKIRKYEYFDDKSNDVKSVTIVNKKTNQTETHTRESKDSDRWSGTNWRGDIRVDSDGVHSVRTNLNGQGASENSRWDSYHPDGRTSSDIIGADGSRTSFDKNTREIVSVRTPDGVRVDKLDNKGQSQIKVYNPRIGESVTWTKGADGKYTSDSPMFKDARSNLSFNAAGELTYQNDKQEKVTETRDGARRIAQPDGTQLEYGADGNIQKAIRGNIERSFSRQNNEISSIVDRNTKANTERVVFNKKSAHQQNIHLSEKGDFSYQNPDGSAVIERVNGLRLELDKEGDLSTVTSDKGVRTFAYLGEGDKKSLVGVRDVNLNEKDEFVAETFTRVIDPNGQLAREFRSDKGSPSRYDLTVCVDGDYEYKQGDKNLASRVAR